MPILNFPNYIHDEIDKVNRNFIWQGCKNGKKIYLINCDTSSNGALKSKKACSMSKGFFDEDFLEIIAKWSIFLYSGS